MKYSDIDGRKKAFIFELDNVLYPEKDYLYQVYYLFASLMEYTELLSSHQITELLVKAHNEDGKELAFDRLKEKLHIDERFRHNLQHLLQTAKLPLKLLLYKNMLDLLQEIVIDRKKIFIVTNGNPEQQLNKIKQTEWHGLEQYLIAYFADESTPKPETNVIELLMKEHDLQRRDLVMIGGTDTDQLCAGSIGIDYLNVTDFL
ncbi:HAD hydrolase-like protein [Mucilaginibacter sp.]|uniref:HAD hydrolase-like protein n=1 Tax=Mucilaginibacter sp. TaxID=1882438 RepID=UPI003D0B3E7A